MDASRRVFLSAHYIGVIQDPELRAYKSIPGRAEGTTSTIAEHNILPGTMRFGGCAVVL